STLYKYMVIMGRSWSATLRPKTARTKPALVRWTARTWRWVPYMLNAIISGEATNCAGIVIARALARLPASFQSSPNMIENIVGALKKINAAIDNPITNRRTAIDL